MRCLIAILACGLIAGQAIAQRETEERKRATVGKLGQFNQSASVYVKPDKRARVLYKGDNQLYVVIRSVTDEWTTIVMADGSSGYVETKFVDRLPYEVNVKDPQPGVGLANRGGYERGSDIGSQIVRDAMAYMGTVYKWGGNDLVRGVDCSGFVQQLFRKYGISLPRTAQEQSFVGLAIGRVDELIAGDRLYFTSGARTRITHTGIYMGNNYFIHSASSNGGVAIDQLSGKWLSMLTGARR